MHTTPIDLAAAQAGRDALSKGDAKTARAHFERATEGGRGDAGVWLGLALACHVLKDEAAKLAALDQVLALEPRNIRALMLKADHMAEAGDSRAASAHYSAAVRCAQAAGQLPPDLSAEIRRAQMMCQRYAQEYQTFLSQQMAARGFDERRSSPRFARAMDILFGKRQVYLQQPRVFYYPELPQIQFYDRAQFPWLDAVEAATDDIREELRSVLKDDNAFTPYVQARVNRPTEDSHGMLNNPNWSSHYLWKDGTPVPDHVARCPKTMKALEDAPLTHIKRRSPSILFSLLRPGARIPPHNGLLNARLICHLPLIVPAGCGFRVGNETREWVEGKAWVFDDTMEHEAWNTSGQLRVILLFDIWRPELSEEERHLFAAVLESIDAYGATGSDLAGGQI